MPTSDAASGAALPGRRAVTLRPVRLLTRSLPLLVALAVLTALVSAVPAAAPASAYAGAPWFRPGTTYLDLSLPDAQNSNFPDASIISDGGTYYAYGATTGGAYLPVMSSTDLIHWTARPA
jgi:arabinan endo-1,5-alpha-L-arabinosidase